MNKSRKIGLFVLTALLMGAAAFWFWGPVDHDVPCYKRSVADLVKFSQVKPNDLVTSPLELNGLARGCWYFEASFPIRMSDSNGVELGIVVAQAQGEWMTEDYVPFATTLTFSAPSTDTGFLVLHKDNPSGLPEFDAEVRIPVRFR